MTANAPKAHELSNDELRALAKVASEHVNSYLWTDFTARLHAVLRCPDPNFRSPLELAVTAHFALHVLEKYGAPIPIGSLPSGELPLASSFNTLLANVLPSVARDVDDELSEGASLRLAARGYRAWLGALLRRRADERDEAH